MNLKRLMALSGSKYILGLILLIIIICVHLLFKYSSIYTIANVAAMEKQANAANTLNLATGYLTSLSAQIQYDSAQIHSTQADLRVIQEELLQLVKIFKYDMAELKQNRQVQTQLLQQIYHELRVSNGAVTDISVN